MIARQALIAKCYGRHIEAARLFQQALSTDPTDDLARYELETYLVAYGKQCVLRGLLHQARYIFRRAIQVNERSMGALASLATLEVRPGHREEAETLWQRALALDPHDVRLRVTIANQNGADTTMRR